MVIVTTQLFNLSLDHYLNKNNIFKTKTMQNLEHFIKKNNNEDNLKVKNKC